MNAETILQSDVLDILFENRNQQYGAYQLRKGYDKRLLKALAIIISLVLLFCIWDYMQHRWKNNPVISSLSPIHDTIKFTQVELPKEPPPVSKQPPHVASVTNPPPVIVPDNMVKDSIHTIDDMANKVISDLETDGPPAISDNQSSAPEQPVADAVNADPGLSTEPIVPDVADVMPEFPGGTTALLRFLGKNLQVPEDVLEPGQKVRVPVKFVVNKEGKLSNVEFLTPANDIFKKEILRVMAKMPVWKAGSQHGRTVAVYYTIPIIFDMTEN